MRHPARTRRLSIAAIVSLLVFVVVAGAGVRSLWISDGWTSGNGKAFSLYDGCACYSCIAARFNGLVTSGHYLVRTNPDGHAIGTAIWGFSATKMMLGDFVATPLMRVVKLFERLGFRRMGTICGLDGQGSSESFFVHRSSISVVGQAESP